ncbi:molybdopterin-binding protein [Micromonospora sp. KC606]|uniref:molybdopterin-dependent oxidoreductase n=1 Tax=Micromonospora sp. KC606 TaxID=2530379 RepID=UPI00104F4DBD|nr:molybdopterin-dependent oxidoreductase [Micromonospora sp. KC606]TDC86192.1 molybdopterin-binding protein [Micromonospora sp. KC606]
MRAPGLPTSASFRSRLHDEKTATLLGLALAVTFTVCFVTGLVSHLIQHPQPWFEWPAAPRNLYRVITATHVVTGFATVPLLAAKLWTVYPKLWARPLFTSWAHAVERISLIPLVGGSLFLVVGGIDDSMYIYINPFTFTPTHYVASWITVGALIIHVAAKRQVTLQTLRRRDTVAGPSSRGPGSPARAAGPPAPAVALADDHAERRNFLITVGAAAGVLGVNFLAANVDPLHDLALLPSRRSDVGTQKLPVQTQATAAGVTERITSPDYRLRVIGQVASPLELDVDDLLARVSHTATLPISCVQGWSVSATWRGVRVRDLLREAGVTDFDEVIVRSIQTTTKPQRMFGRARLNPSHALHPDTLLATELNGERLHMDHGYPVRLIAPNNPGIMQTKWVEELWVR